MNQKVIASGIPKNTLVLNIGGTSKLFYVLSQEEFLNLQNRLLMQESNQVAKDFKGEEPDTSPIMLTREEASRMLHIAKSTLWRWEKDGKLTSVKIGSRRVLYHREQVECLLNGISNL